MASLLADAPARRDDLVLAMGSRHLYVLTSYPTMNVPFMNGWRSHRNM